MKLSKSEKKFKIEEKKEHSLEKPQIFKGLKFYLEIFSEGNNKNEFFAEVIK